jgi:allantoinase
VSTAAYISRRVVIPDEVRPAAVLVDTISGRITRIAERDSFGPVDELYDLGDQALLPGLIDPHVHINEPGRTHWEGFETATRAAAAGGITTIIDMPLNCLPPTTSVAGLEAKRSAAAGKCMVDWRPWGGAENGNQSDLETLAKAGVPGFKCFLVYPGCEGLGLMDEENLRTAMPILAKLGLPLLVHAELPGPIEAAAASLAGKNFRAYATYLASRPDEAELAAIRLLISLCREFRTPIHIVHLATSLGLPLIKAAKAEGLPITVETCPHYLHFAAEDIPDGATQYKCAPPIRSRANRELLLQAAADGTLDLIASDHSPCPPAMKGPTSGQEAGDFAKAWGGIASLSLGASILATNLGAPCLASETWDEAAKLRTLARLMSSAPAKLADIATRKGRIAEGFDADLTVFAPEESFIVTPRDLHFRHSISPYLGERLTGRVRQTILRGTRIFHDGAFPSPPIGREVPA